jgi:hypothetical protein
MKRQSHNALVAAIVCVAGMGASYFIGLALNRGRIGIRRLPIPMTLATMFPNAPLAAVPEPACLVAATIGGVLLLTRVRERD